MCTTTCTVAHDNGSKFTTEFQELLASYGIESNPTTVENPRSNLVERMHRTLGDRIRTEDFEDIEDPLPQKHHEIVFSIFMSTVGKYSFI